MGLLDGKTTIITGVGRGIGKATAEVFVREGAQVLGVDISGAEKDTAAALGGSVVPCHADLTKEEDIVAMVAAAEEAFGRVDALVNVAGTIGGRGGQSSYLSAEEYDLMMPVNLRAVLLACQHGIEAMLRGGGGSIVNFSSVGGINVESMAPAAYMAAKAGVHALTKAIAVEYGRQGIRANVVAPGFTLTELVRDVKSDAIEALKRKSALGRPGECREQGEVAAFLASDRASFVTGAVIPVDGGWSAQLP
ncbi:short-chain dehydrogenase [Pseudofrankia sp. BMG5.36]|nr:short-chain dehydrogenase [Pseudofrankia sp. BMG5.36]